LVLGRVRLVRTHAPSSFFRFLRGVCTKSIPWRSKVCGHALRQYREIDPHWSAIKMLRIPASRQGGFDLWNWGKMTYRASSFREGNNYLRYIARVYEQATRAIEDAVWLGAEPTQNQNQTEFRLTGMPVVFTFGNPLSVATFQNFITTTFERGQGPFRLWGNPIVMGPGKVHVYGMDLHLWQQLYMELTPHYFLFVLPKGTCGNTVHRLRARQGIT